MNSRVVKLKENVFFRANGEKATLVSFEIDNYFLLDGAFVPLISHFLNGVEREELSDSGKAFASYLWTWGLLENSQTSVDAPLTLELPEGSIRSVEVVIHDYQLYSKMKVNIE